MVQETVEYHTTADHRPDSPSTDDGGGEVLSEKDLRRQEKERREHDKRLKADRERAEKLAKKEHDRLEKLAKKKEKEEQKSRGKTSKTSTTTTMVRTDHTSPSPAYTDEVDDADMSPPVSPVGGVPMQTTIPAAYEHVTEEISAQASGPGAYASNTIRSNLSVNTNGRTRDLVVPVIPADRTATPGGTLKPGSTQKAVVRLLSDQDAEFYVPKNATGQELFERVCEFINLQERDYFGIRFMDTDNEKSWLNMEKTIKQQVKGGPWVFEFLVKFYPPQPTELKEDLTRYYLCMQIHRDLITERLPASFTTLAVLGSLMVQSELGDYERSTHRGNYVSEVPLAPPSRQNAELEEKVMELHKESTRGMAPTEADLRYLENAKRLAFYGIDLHKAKDKDNTDIKVGVSASGIHVYRGNLRINRFAWPKILKLSYRRSNFYIKIRQMEFEDSEKEIQFKCPYEKAAKRLWKVAIEHHTFFRMRSSEEPSDYSTLRWPRLGSRFRYSGRTYSEAKASSEKIDRQQPEFQRTWSKRNPYSVSVDGLNQQTTLTHRQQSLDGTGRPVSVSDYESRRRELANGSNNVYDQPIKGGRVAIAEGAHGGYGYGSGAGGLGDRVYQTDYTKTTFHDDKGSPTGGGAQLLTNNSVTQESRTTVGGVGPDGLSRGSSVFSSPDGTLKSRTEFEYIPNASWRGRDADYPSSPTSGDGRGYDLGGPYRGYGDGRGAYSPTYSTAVKNFGLDGEGNRSPGGTLTSTRYNRQEYYTNADGSGDDATKVLKIPVGGVGVMTTTYGNVTEYTTRTKTTTSTIKSTIEKYPGAGGGPGGNMDSTTLTTRSINGPSMSPSASDPLGSPRRRTETHPFGATAPNVVSTKVKTTETTTFEVDRNGEKETHVEERVTILTDGEDIDHDQALAEAIQNATNLNPKMKVEKIEIDHAEG
ncbi:band 4.1-like protein 2 isoform X1 [Paramacrobiotus metropolitanus]|uniref:band 4.1-like protein 2 isoform X1 n=1 Tax=Paramacrobiotus metropolitanus TaxID=2943436 RepID=UPI00244620A0|nr:band 4.1-like protein 2 isoform X1 [Paramacrobiotus metropolitanus]XP_055333732.1 band 4.1-like protein 2 isoform X1 [Paramacrobiotus metropolitanus]